MRVVRWVAVSTLAVAMSMASMSGRVDAIDGAGSGGAADGTIWAGVQTGTPPIEGSASTCTWTMEGGYDSSTGESSDAPITMTMNGIEYILYTRTCSGWSTVVWVPQLDPAQLAQQASVLVRGRLSSPAVHFAPPADAGVVTVPTWIWADRSWWKPVSATAWLPTPSGVIWARATATPVRMTFSTEDSLRDGDGRRSVVCDGPGEEWDRSIGDDGTSNCSYTYRHASTSHASGRFDASVAVDWEISWQSNVGSGGRLPGYTTSTSLRLTVQELHALVG